MYCPHLPRLPRPPQGRPRLYAITFGMGLAAGACITLMVAVVLARESPAWWQPVNREDPRTTRSASDLENGIVTSLSQVRPADHDSRASAPWEFIVSAADANAWLNTRLPRWLANQSDGFTWPPEISEVQVDFRDDQVLVGVQLRTGESSQILCASVVPRFQDGALYAPAQSLSLGRLPVPRSWLLSSDPSLVAEERIPKPLRDLPQTSGLAVAFGGQSPVVQSPVIKLGDGRRIRLLSITPRDGELHVTCRTEPR